MDIYMSCIIVNFNVNIICIVGCVDSGEIC